MRFYRGIVLLVVFSLSACTFGVPVGDNGRQPVTKAPKTTRSQQGNPSSYVVYGKRYYVLDSAVGFKQRGKASWYGTKFHGRSTSSGEVYNMHAMTAAHKTLPIPVYVHVKNLDNGRSMVVRVNDRGPFISGRIIDLSYAAAKKLGVDGPGTANVEISALAEGQSKPTKIVRSIPLMPEIQAEVPLFIQMGSFSSHVNANNLVQNLIDANESSAKISSLKTDTGLFYRVRVGPLFDIDEANAVVRRLRNKGFQTARIVVQDDAE
ncbi:MAG: septal ring lytic transglycosylase RlpA family protein [Gammaproteobacteria bacterium]|nr:septal ring lytic transglycosylase RlpA family protein [Gammaproteobacteria bacterium]